VHDGRPKVFRKIHSHLWSEALVGTLFGARAFRESLGQRALEERNGARRACRLRTVSLENRDSCGLLASSAYPVGESLALKESPSLPTGKSFRFDPAEDLGEGLVLLKDP